MRYYSQDELLRFRDQNESWLMSQPGVNGTSIGLDGGGRIVLRIFTKNITRPIQQNITSKFADVPIAWEAGDVVAYRG